MHRINITLVCFLIFTIVSSALAYKIVISSYDSYENIYSENYLVGKPNVKNNYKDLIKISHPKPNQIITSPFTVKGEARGTWYFEASFPVRLYDGNNVEIALAPAQAQGDWMTTSFVPFQVTLNFNTPATPTGTLVLEKDNPSGEPALDDAISIPVKFY